MASPQFSLAHLTVLSLPPPEMLRVAARTGYQTVGLRLIAVTDTSPGYRLMDDRAAMRETKRAIAETGVGVHDIEFVRITPELSVATLDPVAAAGAELGARYLITAPYDPDLSRLAERLAAIGELAERHGLSAVIEFFPWTVVSDLGAASKLVARTGRTDVGILVDTLHFDRSQSSLEELGQIPPARLPFVHVADAPVQASYTTEELLHAARDERLPPGEGAIDIPAILAHMPAALPIALEIPMSGFSASHGPEAVARRVRLAAERLLAPERGRDGPSTFAQRF